MVIGVSNVPIPNLVDKRSKDYILMFYLVRLFWTFIVLFGTFNSLLIAIKFFNKLRSRTIIFMFSSNIRVIS